jgi:hypothetical protein
MMDYQFALSTWGLKRALNPRLPKSAADSSRNSRARAHAGPKSKLIEWRNSI